MEKNAKLKEALKIYRDDQMSKTADEYSSSSEKTFSKEFEEKMQKLITDSKSPESKRKFKKPFILIAAVILILLSSLMSVGAVREAVGNFLYTVFSDRVEIHFDAGDEARSSIEEIYLPSYIPGELELVSQQEFEGSLFYEYSDGVLESFSFRQYLDNELNASIGTQNSQAGSKLTEIYLGDIKATYVEHQHNREVMWVENGYVFTVETSMPYDEMIKIAKSVEVQSEEGKKRNMKNNTGADKNENEQNKVVLKEEEEQAKEDAEGRTILRWMIDSRKLPNSTYLNKLLNEKGFNCMIEFVPITADPVATGKDYDFNGYIEAAKEFKKNGTSIDIIYSTSRMSSEYNDPYFDFYKNGLVTPLNDYLENDNKLLSAYDKKVWDALRLDGEIYGVSNNWNIPWQHSVIYDKDLLEKYNIDPNLFKQPVWEWEEALQKVKDGEGIKPLSYIDAINILFPNLTNIGEEYLVFDESTDELKIESLFENADVKKAWETLDRYLKIGLMTSNEEEMEKYNENNTLPYLQGNFAGANLISDRSYFEDFFASENANLDTIKIGESVLPYRWMSVNFISSWSENKDLAFSVLSAIMTDEELSNALSWGEETVDYTLKDDKGMSLSEKGYKDLANNLLVHPDMFESKNKLQSYPKLIEEAKTSKIHGFRFDGSECKEEIDKMFRVMYKLTSNLDYSKNLDEINKEFNDAGMQKVLKEANRQLKEWSEKEKN